MNPIRLFLLLRNRCDFCRSIVPQRLSYSLLYVMQRVTACAFQALTADGRQLLTNYPLPHIDWQRCTGCRRCVDICPTQALAQVDGKAMLCYPDACTYCTSCEEICPEQAISLPFLIVLAKRKGE